MQLKAHFDEALLVVEAIRVGHNLELAQFLGAQDDDGLVFLRALFDLAKLEVLNNFLQPVVTTLVAVLTMTGILISDILYCLVDPRIQLQ